MIQKLRLTQGHVSAIHCLCALVLLLPACTNNLGSSRSIASYKAGAPASGTSQDTSGVFSVVKIVQNATNNKMIDLIGNGTGQFADFCVKDVSDPTTSNCECVYSYSGTGGGVEVGVPVTYQENEVARCSTALIPSSAGDVTVRLRVLNQGVYSNSLILTFSNGTITGTSSSVDTSEVSNFAEVKRYQCKDFPFVPYPSYANGRRTLTSVPYDPLQSEDPRYSYPLNYYTTDIGYSMRMFAQTRNGESRFECSFNNASPAPWINPRIYSVGGDPADSGSKEVVNVSGGRSRRSTFYVSKTNTGVFSVPVKMKMAPYFIISGTLPQVLGGSTTVRELGYAAKPIATGSGERCPNSSEATIPTGYRWVKVWNFKSDLPARRALASSAEVTNTPYVGCNPGRVGSDYSQKTVRDLAFVQDCEHPTKSDSSGFRNFRALDVDKSSSALSPAAGTVAKPVIDETQNELAARVFVSRGMLDQSGSAAASMACVVPVDPSAANASYLSDPDTQAALAATFGTDVIKAGRALAAVLPANYDDYFPPGTDLYSRVGPIAFSQAQYCTNAAQALGVCADNFAGTYSFGTGPSGLNATSGSASQTAFPWNMNRKRTGSSTERNGFNSILDNTTASTDTVLRAAWKTNEVGAPFTYIDLDAGLTREDYLFVVTPPEVTAVTLVNKLSGYDAYYPFTYKNAGDCTAADPDAAAPGTCLLKDKIGYEIWTYRVGEPDPANASEAFPVCALQPDDLAGGP